MSLPDRILDRIDPAPDGCHLWTGAVGQGGYGNTYFEGKYVNVHRLIAGAVKGDVVRHTCDVKLCCNPHHLIIGTQQDNIDDMVSKGRQKKGALSDEQVIEARKLYADGRHAKEIIADLDLPIGRSGLYAALYGTKYGHIPGERHRKNKGWT